MSRLRREFRSSLAIMILLSSAVATCASAQLPAVAPNLARIEGNDSDSGIAYTRLFISSIAAVAAQTDTAFVDLSQPTLTAQCTQRPNGRRFFELFVNFGGVTDTSYYRPWRPADGGHFPPTTTKVTVTMEFLGYTKVKPMKRQWEHVIQPDGQLRYTQPGGGTNLEEASYFFQYLRALPTLKVTAEGHTASFLTTTLQAQLLKEPLCGKSGL